MNVQPKMSSHPVIPLRLADAQRIEHKCKVTAWSSPERMAGVPMDSEVCPEENGEVSDRHIPACQLVSCSVVQRPKLILAVLPILSRYHLKDVIVGKIYFLLVRIKIKHMEIDIIKRETTGTGPNVYHENDTIAKYEIMDGAPVRGEKGWGTIYIPLL